MSKNKISWQNSDALPLRAGIRGSCLYGAAARGAWLCCVSIRLRSTSSEIQHCHTSAVVSLGVSARERQLPAEEDAAKERGKPQP